MALLDREGFRHQSLQRDVISLEHLLRTCGDPDSPK
ncbi:hypothetical protein E2C01_101163 [Portunus trituberculatus]|uniref:Uncharacterized protein n=1 Tax=Portunus trituberculatus TaxID=210409 RepID=A0A5B7K9Y5_PORTR|nr:hypothetical protein [Portunus trituberculatus]